MIQAKSTYRTRNRNISDKLYATVMMNMEQQSMGDVSPKVIVLTKSWNSGMELKFRVRKSKNKAGPGLKIDLNLEE